MNKDLSLLKKVLSNLINIYEKALKVLQREREYLVKIDSDNLLKIIEQKQQLAERVEEEENNLKNILTKNGVENISELLFFASELYDVDNIRILNGKLRELLKEFRIKTEVNNMIAKEHAEFFNGLLSIYTSAFINTNYDRYANANIDTQIMSLRV